MRLLTPSLAASPCPPPWPRRTIAPAEYAARRDSLAARIDSGIVVAFGAPAPDRGPAPGPASGLPLPDRFPRARRGAHPGRPRGPRRPARSTPRRAIRAGRCTTASRPTRPPWPGRPASPRARSRLWRPTLDSLAETGLPFYTLRDYAGADYSRNRFAHPRCGLPAGVPGRRTRGSTSATRTRSSTASARGRARPSWRCSAARSTSPWPRTARRCARVRPGVWEYEIDALFASAFRRTGGDGPAFGSIVGSGPNSTQYHYDGQQPPDAGGRRGRDGRRRGLARLRRGRHAHASGQRPVHAPTSARSTRSCATRRPRRSGWPGPARPYVAWRDSARAVIARGVARLGLTEGVDATFDPPWADQCRARAGPLHPVVPLHGARARVTASGWRCTIRRGPGRTPDVFAPGDVFTIEPGIYVSTRLLDILPDTPKNRAMIAKVRAAVERYRQHRHPDRGRLRDHRHRRRVAEPGPAGDRRGRGRDGAPWPIGPPRRPRLAARARAAALRAWR